MDALISGVLLIHGKYFSSFNTHSQMEEFKFCSSVFDFFFSFTNFELTNAGQDKAYGWLETRIKYAKRIANVDAVTKELLRVVYPFCAGY